MLTISNLQVFHGPIEAVHGITLSISEGQCVALLGPNGAGKTSTLSAIAGIATSRGQLQFLETDLDVLSVEERKRQGIALAPEGRRIFSNLTVYENLAIGAAIRRDKAGIKRDIDRWFESFPVLKERREQSAGTLSGGEQQMLTIARALMSNPRILLLDEPSLGLAPLICKQIFELIGELKASGMTILLVEQNARDAMKLADYVYLMNSGRIAAEGDPNAEKSGKENGQGNALGDLNALMAELTGIH